MDYRLNLLIRGGLAVLIPYNLLLYIFKPLTLYINYVLLYIVGYNPIISFDSILVGKTTLIFAPACIAVSAYYLLLLLVLFTKCIVFKKRIYCFLLGSLLILILNVIRIFILSLLVINYHQEWFELIHMLFWYAVSGVYVALIWIFLVHKFKIKSIPIYSDLEYLYKKSILGKIY